MLNPEVLKDTPMVTVKNVTMTYGKVEALHDVSINIPPRTLIGLIGPDGVGKSSLLSIITAAHAMPKVGEIQVLGGDLRDKEHRSRICPKIAYMPQGLGKNLYFTLTVEENLQYFGRLFGHDAAERRRRIDLLTKSTGLYPFLDRPAGKLSGGMKQKLGLCCSLIHDPDMLVLDEPTTGVDPLARRQFWDLVDNVRIGQPQMGVIVATAYMDEAQRFDWLIAMDDGKILATGTPQELMERTHTANLDDAFIQLLPESKRANHRSLVVPPLECADNEAFAIEAEGLTKQFGKFTAVDHVSFKIRQGEIFGFLGSNGCGKTTTMRMLCGLIPATEGKAQLFGKPVNNEDIAVRLNLGYMTQLFSLYTELTVRQNMELFGGLYRIPKEELGQRIDEMMTRFDLHSVADVTPSDLPLGIKQRLSLAVAAIHRPKILILDEPTSGVDPVARDGFWELIIELSRKDKVTIFITTHFMNEAARCDRISLMHAGRSLACDKPEALIAERKASTLEEAFISYLEEADKSPKADASEIAKPAPQTAKKAHESKFEQWCDKYFNMTRLLSCSWRETLELLRDPIRLTLATIGAMLLMIVIGYGINLDVEDLPFAVLDNDQSQASISYTQNIAGSRYFVAHRPVKNHTELDARMESGELSMVVEIPTDFGKKLDTGVSPEVAFWIDGSNPNRSATIGGYVAAMHNEWLQRRYSTAPKTNVGMDFNIQTRNRYNPDVKSLPAMVPAVMPLLMLMIPAILAALSVVREKEQGSITNLYVTPLSRAEFILGKQLPYIGFALISNTLLILLSVFLFKVPVKGSLITLYTALLIYSCITTGFGLLASSVTKSQIAVIFLTMLATMIPAEKYCGLINPVSTLQGSARMIGEYYPTAHMLTICRGVFNKALGFSDLHHPFIVMLITVPIISTISILLQKKQES